MPSQLKIFEQAVFYLQKNQQNTVLVQQSLVDGNAFSTTKQLELTEKMGVSDINQDASKLLYSQYGKPQGGIMKMQLKH